MVELLIYIFLLALLLTVMINSTVLLSASYRNIKSVKEIESSAISTLDRMVKEIRAAESVDTTQTAYNISPGALKINTTDSGGNPTTMKFYLVNQRLMMDQGGVQLGPLTTQSVRVTNLVFRSIATSTIQAIKIEMTIESGASTYYVTKNFYGTATLRGSYQ